MNYDNPQLAVRHIPEPNAGPFETIQDALAVGYDQVDPVTGIVQVGVMLDGAFIPLLSEKASLVHDAIQLAKKNAQASTTTPPAETAGTPGSGIPAVEPPATEPPAEPTG